MESLGGKFLSVDQSENLETKGGYAKEVSEEFKKKQAELLKATLIKVILLSVPLLFQGNLHQEF